jgi:3-dehydroquinate synthase
MTAEVGAGAATVQTALAIGDGIISALGEKMREAGLDGRAFVVTDRRVAAACGTPACESLSRAGFGPALLAIEGGESAKTLDGAAEIYSWLADERAERRDVIVALGGGVIGDLAGFVAATYLRGMALVQVPTTVLAQVDSSVGGKTAINLPQGKNLVGAFHPARLTLIDVGLLHTLPPREFRAGWAEVIKTAAIFDEALFEQLEAIRPESLDRGQLLDIIARCVRWKAKVVEEDPTERGPRMVLNFGHTIGHALEAATGYERYLHGEAVAIGMVGAAELSRRLGLIDQRLAERLEGLLARTGLPVRYDASITDAETILAMAATDKKAHGARLRWVLLEGLGRTRIAGDVPLTLVRDVLDFLAAPTGGSGPRGDPGPL